MADVADIRSLLERRITPCVLLASCPSAETIAKDHGFAGGMLDVTRPFFILPNDVHLQVGRDPADTRLATVSGFGARVHNDQTILETRPDIRPAVMSAEMRNCAQDELDAALKTLSTIERIASGEVPVGVDDEGTTFSTGKSNTALRHPTLTPAEVVALSNASFPAWFSRFVANYCAMLRFSYLDTIDHPVCLLYAVQTSATIAEALNELKAADSAGPQRIMSTYPHVDASLMKIVLLLHDVGAGLPDTAEEHRRQIVERFCPQGHCYVIKFDSRQRSDGTAQVDANPFSQTLDYLGFRVDQVMQLLGTEDGSPATARSARLPKPFYEELQRTIQHVLRNNIIMAMQKKLRDLREFIDQNRQTTLDRIANFFGKKEQRPQREAFAPMPGGDGRYFYYSLEMQMRRAGDLSFMLHDYESAAYHYKQYRDELEAKMKERPFNRKLLPGAIEAIAMANAMLGRLPMPGTPKQESKLEIATGLYTAADVHSHSFRASLLLVAQCRVRSVPANDRALQVLTRLLQTQMPPLYRGMIGDQAALCWIMFNPPFPGTLGVGEGYLEPSARRPGEGYAPLTFIRKYAQLALAAAFDYRSGASPAQDEHALRCAAGVWAVLKHRNGKTYGALCAAVLGVLVDSYRRLGLLKEAAMTARTLCCSGSGSSLDMQQYLTLVRQYQASLTEWTPSGATAQAEAAAAVSAAPTVSSLLMFPMLQAGSARVEVNTFATDATTENEEVVLGASNDTAPAVSSGPSRVAQAWNNHLEAARKHFASTKVPLGRTLSHHKLTLLTSVLQARKLVAANKGDPDAALARLRQVSVSCGGPGVAFSVHLENPLQDASVRISQPRLLVAELAQGASVSGTRVAVDTLNGTTHRGVYEDAVVPPRGTTAVDFDFDTSTEGVFVVVGVRWTIDGVVCDSYFAAAAAADPQHPDAASRVMQEAVTLTKKGLGLEHAAHTVITVLRPEATITTDFDPPLPASVLDGELHHTSLVLRTSGAAATNVRVVFSKCCFNLIYPADSEKSAPDVVKVTCSDSSTVPLVTRVVGADRSVSFNVDGSLPAGSELRIPLVYRGEGGYTKRLATPQSAVVFNSIMAMTIYTTAPRTDGPKAASSFATNAYVSKLLRRVRIHRSVSLTSTVMPPTSPCMPTILQLAIDNVYVPSSGGKAPPIPKRNLATSTVDSFFDGVDSASPTLAPLPQAQPENTMKIVRLAAVSAGYQVVALGNGGLHGVAAHLSAGRRATVALGSTVSGLAAFAENVTTPVHLLQENVCVGPRAALNALDDTAMASALAAADKVLSGRGTCDSPWQLHFLLYGAAVGAEPVDCGVPLEDGMSFYSDGGDDENKQAALEAQRKREEEEKRRLAEALRQATLTPITVVAVWRFAVPPATVGAQPQYRFGVVFHSTDGSALKKCAMLQRQRFKLPSALTIDAASTVQPRKPDQGTISLTADGLGRVEGCFLSEPQFGAACATGTFTVIIRNMSVYTVNARLSVEPVFGTIFAPHPPINFVGKTAWELKLAPRAQTTVPVTAVFFAPGVYNVSCMQLRVRSVVDELSGNVTVVQPTILVTGNDTPWIMTVVSRAPKTTDVPFASPIRAEASVGRRSITLPMETVNARLDAAAALLSLASPAHTKHAASPGGGAALDFARSPLQDASEVVRTLRLLSPPQGTGAAAETSMQKGSDVNLLAPPSPQGDEAAALLSDASPMGPLTAVGDADSAPSPNRELYFDPMSNGVFSPPAAAAAVVDNDDDAPASPTDEGLLEPSHTMLAEASADFRRQELLEGHPTPEDFQPAYVDATATENAAAVEAAASATGDEEPEVTVHALLVASRAAGDCASSDSDVEPLGDSDTVGPVEAADNPMAAVAAEPIAAKAAATVAVSSSAVQPPDVLEGGEVEAGELKPDVDEEAQV